VPGPHCTVLLHWCLCAFSYAVTGLPLWIIHALPRLPARLPRCRLRSHMPFNTRILPVTFAWFCTGSATPTARLPTGLLYRSGSGLPGYPITRCRIARLPLPRACRLRAACSALPAWIPFGSRRCADCTPHNTCCRTSRALLIAAAFNVTAVAGLLPFSAPCRALLLRSAFALLRFRCTCTLWILTAPLVHHACRHLTLPADYRLLPRCCLAAWLPMPRAVGLLPRFNAAALTRTLPLPQLDSTRFWSSVNAGWCMVPRAHTLPSAARLLDCRLLDYALPRCPSSPLPGCFAVVATPRLPFPAHGLRFAIARLTHLYLTFYGSCLCWIADCALLPVAPYPAPRRYLATLRLRFAGLPRWFCLPPLPCGLCGSRAPYRLRWIARLVCCFGCACGFRLQLRPTAVHTLPHARFYTPCLLLLPAAGSRLQRASLPHTAWV